THSLSLLLYLVPLPRDPPSFPPRRSSDLRIPWRNPPAPRWGSISLESLFRPDPRRSPADPLHGSEASDGFPSESPPVPNRRCDRSEEHTSELQSRENLVCRLLLEKKNKNQ